MTLTATQHRWIYLFALACIVVGLPFSRALVSIGEVILTVNFVLEGHWKQRWQEFKRQPTIWLFIGVYAVHAIGLLWSEDLAFGLKDLRVKLPLLIFPIIIPLSQRLRRTEFLWIVAIFSGAVIVASFFSTYQFLTLQDVPGADFRDISLFISHIRYALMVCLSYIILLNCAWNEEKQFWLRIVYILLALWMSVFIFILQSMTGIVVWLLCSYILLFYTIFHMRQQVMRIVGSTVLILAPLLIGSYLLVQVDAFYPDERPDFSKLEKVSAGGEPYGHDTVNLALENGYYINQYVATNELKRAWNRRSDIPYVGGKDARDQFIFSTVIRYMTSKGLRKDSLGVSALTDEDIRAIESGIANVRFIYGNPIDNRIYTVLWEFDKMMQEKRVQGHSVTQRVEFWKTGWHIFLDNMWFGVGSGDLNRSFEKMYEELDSELGKAYRLRAHNQVLTIAISLGIVGLLIFLASVVYPFLRLRNANTFLYIGFAIIIYTSMLNEDTLETQFGVTLYAFFNAFLLYSLSALSPSDDKTSS